MAGLVAEQLQVSKEPRRAWLAQEPISSASYDDTKLGINKSSRSVNKSRSKLLLGRTEIHTVS